LTDEELSRAAINEQYPDSNMPYDWLAWYKLRDVYRDFKAGKISKKQGEDAKKNIFQSRQKEINEKESSQAASLRFGQFWAKVEDAGRAYMKDPTIEHADDFVRTVYGVGRLKRPDETEKPAT